MIKVVFPEDGSVAIQFPKEASKKAFDRYNQIMGREGGIDPVVALMLAIAATNGPKIFDRAARIFNVA